MSERASYRQRVGTDDILITAITYAASWIVLLALLAATPFGALGPALTLIGGLGAAALAAAATVAVCLRVSINATLRSIGLRPTSGRWLLLGAAGGLLLPVVSVILIGLYLSFASGPLPDRGLSATPT